ncbi:fluoride efflux transporter CrcB [Bacillus sp. T3]|uniref:fluoride efflux transporter CrcB n=1 Tax=Bacillus sp. T3 TaxID=467262 RepID=UPI002980BBFF|nr:fluoride efflux transporter CrcB [Bacillus sp. T3]
MKLIFVMLGGFFGAICRFALGEWLNADNGFPIGTLIINILGCFFLGWFLTFGSIKKKVNPELTLLIGTGFTGAFTTFSTFSVETLRLLQKDFIFQAVIYVLLSIFVGLGMSYIGWRIAKSRRHEGGTV